MTPKKAPPKKSAIKKKSAAKKKTAAKKAPQKKAATSRTKSTRGSTTITARIDVGFGNELYLRGEGGGLSWEKGTPMECVRSGEWTWSTSSASTGIVFKFLLNDQLWSLGEDLIVASGGTSVSTPRF